MRTYACRLHRCVIAFINVFQPWQLLLVTLAGWINWQQRGVIAYIQEENRILKNKLKGKRIRFTDDERRRLGPTFKSLIRHFQERQQLGVPDILLPAKPAGPEQAA